MQKKCKENAKKRQEKSKKMENKENKSTFVPTVHTTLPIRTASQGVSFAFIPFLNLIISTFLNRKHVY